MMYSDCRALITDARSKVNIWEKMFKLVGVVETSELQ